MFYLIAQIITVPRPIAQIITIVYITGLLVGLGITLGYWATRPKPHVPDPADPISVPTLLVFSVLWFIPCTYFIKRRFNKQSSSVS
jgi:hypothetical protein